MKGLSEKAAIGGFTLALLLLSGVGGESYLSVNKLIESQRWIDHTQRVLDTLEQLSRSIEAADQGRRSYFILKNDGELTTWRTGVQATRQAIAAMRQLTIDNPKQQQRLTKVEPLITKRLTLLQQFVDLVRQNKLRPGEQDTILKQNIHLQQQIQEHLQVMEQAERTLLQQRSDSTERIVQQAIVVASIGYGFSFCLLASIFFLLQKEIRSRKAAEIALQKHAEDVYDLYNHAPCGYHSLDATGTFIRINETELKWLGYTRDEILHKKTFGDLLTPQSSLVFQESFPHFKEQGWISDVEFELVCKDGTLLPVSLSATAIKDAEGNYVMSRSTLFDVRERRRAEAERKQAQVALQQANEQLEARVQERTAELSQVNALLRSELIERKQAEHALSQSEKQLRLITNALPVLISYVDAEQCYRFNNRAYEQWFGHGWTTLHGKHLREVLGKSAYQTIQPYAEAALSGQDVSYESSIPYQDGGTRWISAVYIPDFGEQGAVKGYFALVSDITERKLAEEALRESKERLNFALQTAEMGDWDLNLSSGAAHRSLRHDQIFGYDCLQPEWTYEKFLTHVLPDDRAIVDAKFGAALTKAELWDFECRIQRVDGSLRWIWARGHLYHDNQGETVRMLGLIADITDRKVAEAALRESEQRLSLAIEGSGMATWDVNLQTGEALWSAQHFTLLGYEPVPSGTATLSMWQRCVHPDDLESVVQTAEWAIQTQSFYRSEHRIRRVDNGQIVWLAAFGRVLHDDAGQASRFLGIILDISDRKLAEQALQHMNEALEVKVQERTLALKQVNADLVRSNQELEQFAYVASHDLQEPLRAIMGYTQLLTQDYRDRLDETAQSYGIYIVEGAARMQQLIQDLLHYSRAGTCDLVFAPTDCNAVLEQVLHTLQIAIAESNAIITHDPLPTVTADKSQLAQLLQNLIGNAIKFCREGVPRIHISAVREVRQEATFDVSAQPNSAQPNSAQPNVGERAGEARGATQNLDLFSPTTQSARSTSLSDLPPDSLAWLFSVRDHGIGIKPRYLERIFEIFKRLHTRTEFPGTGIGLAICKKIVDRHGGQIWATSELGNGTTFYFTIPSDDHSSQPPSDS